MTEQSNRENRGGLRNMTAGILLGLAIGAVLGLIEGDLLSGLGFGLVIGLALGVAFERRGNFMQYPPYIVRRMLVSVGLFVLAVLASQRLLEESLSRPLEMAVALAPALAFLLLVLSVATAIASLDELQRRIQTEAIAIGFGFTALVVMTYGMLGLVGLAQPNWVFVTLPLVVGWGLGKVWTLWKYR